MKKFKQEKDHYASYTISMKRGSRGKHGSSIAESNHSSVLSFLNEGLKGQNYYCEDPHTLVKDLFNRQKRHIIKWNQAMYNERNSISILQRDIDKKLDPSLYEASNLLCLRALQDFMTRLKHAQEYSKQTKSQTHVIIHSLEHPNAAA